MKEKGKLLAKNPTAGTAGLLREQIGDWKRTVPINGQSTRHPAVKQETLQ